MANIAEVLAESLRLDFGSKLDNTDNHLSDEVNSIVAIQSKLSAVERNVSANTTRTGETNTYNNNRRVATHSRGISLSY